MSKKILLVEDNPDINSIYQETLQEAGYQVDSSFNGTNALNLAQHNEYDLILLDVMLPGINGISVLKEIRQLDNHKSTSIYMLTVLDQNSVTRQALHNGANGILVKSEYTPDKLLSRIEGIINKKISFS